LSANREMLEPVCSKMAQKISAAKKKTRMAAMRLLSWLGPEGEEEDGGDLQGEEQVNEDHW
jgi:hypothetical protein